MSEFGELWPPIWLTLKLAVVTTLVLLLLGTPIAWWLARSKARWKEAVAAIVALPLVLPPTVLGFYILIAIGPASPAGRLYADLAGQTLPFTFEGLLVASVLYSLPFAVQPFSAAFGAVDQRRRGRWASRARPRSGGSCCRCRPAAW
jgi:molybdate transport system permease protein